MTIRLLVADDHTIMREGLRHILEDARDIEIADEVVNGVEALARIRQDDIDLLLLDLSMPGQNGVDLIREIRLIAPRLPILVLTMHDEVQHAAQAMHAGARGYVTKGSAVTELLTAIRKVASGRPYITIKVAEQLAVHMMPASRDLPHLRLTERESEVFKLLAGGKSVTTIAAMLELSIKTVSTHKANIMNKMELGSISEMIQYAMTHHLIGIADHWREAAEHVTQES